MMEPARLIPDIGNADAWRSGGQEIQLSMCIAAAVYEECLSAWKPDSKTETAIRNSAVPALLVFGVFGIGVSGKLRVTITKKAKPKYREIISELPEFEKGDRFKINLVNCAMIGAFILSMPERPDVERLTEYYAKSMMTKPMKWFCQMSGKNKFTEKDISGMKAAAALKAADRNPLFLEYGVLRIPRRQRLRGRFTKCGICVLMKKLGLYDLTPALCRLDYTMSEAGGATDFVRQYIASACCGYKRRAS